MSDQRLNDLEARYAWLERQGVEQDRAIAEMGEALRRLRRELETLKARARLAGDPSDAPDAPEPPPPHY